MPIVFDNGAPIRLPLSVCNSQLSKLKEVHWGEYICVFLGLLLFFVMLFLTEIE